MSDWNKLTTRTVTIFDEFLADEILSVTKEYYNNIEFQLKMLNDTQQEKYERKRRKYLERKYFSIWLEKSMAANEERFILNELQTKYHFLNNEQLLEFLTGLQIMTEHDLTVEQTSDLLKYRRYLKKNRIVQIQSLSASVWEDLLLEELHSIVLESNQELKLRTRLLENALSIQFIQRREHFLELKYFSLWFVNYHRRRRVHKQRTSLTNVNKRTNPSVQQQSNKKLKENHQRYHRIKTSFDQLTSDLNQMQSIINKLSS